jgi:hypothetical protein
MLKLRPILLIICALETSFAAATTEEDAQLFDPIHGVILSGSEGKVIADACGGTSSTVRSATLTPIDIGRLERKLAPLLAADLRNSGSTAMPHQYYRQYASGRLGPRSAIFINGFHESLLLSSGEESNWRTSAITVLDGGDSYWCAVYIKDTGEFVRFKGPHFDTHVWFHGLA